MTAIIPERPSTFGARVRPASPAIELHEDEETTTLSVTLSNDSMHQLLQAFQVAGRDEGYDCIDDMLAEAIHKETLRLQRNYNQYNQDSWGV